jgi:hypothetical protein
VLTIDSRTRERRGNWQEMHREHESGNGVLYRDG